MSTPPLPALTAAKDVPRGADVIVVGLTDAGLRGVPESTERAFAKRYQTSVADMAVALGAKAAEGTRRTLPAAGDGPRIVVVGLGAVDPGPEALRRAAGVGVRYAGSLADGGALSVAVSLGTTTQQDALAVAEGALLGSYRYVAPSGREAAAGGVEAVTVVHRDAVTRSALDAAVTVAAAVLTAREWINLPANYLYPETMAEAARTLVADSKVAIEVLDEKALARGGYGGLTAVGGGSVRPPRLVRLSYSPRGAKSHLALVGKGITFDSGGLNLKPGDGMYTMKSDMSGAAVVLAATHAIAQLGLKVKVTAYGALAENMPSGTAYRPSDVLTMYGGTTVENGNSDAEGRIVMADALVRAGEDEPDFMVDVATLTGACVVALGERTGGVMTNEQAAADRVLAAAETAGEAFWQLPMPPEIRPRLESKVADLRSTATDRWAGALVAATFLREFVPQATPWVHLDIAGPAFHEGKPYGYVSPGGTGIGVRTLIALARSLAS